MNYLDLWNLDIRVAFSGILWNWMQELYLLCVLMYELCVGLDKNVGGTITRGVCI